MISSIQLETSGLIEELTIEETTFWRSLLRKGPSVEVYITSNSGDTWFRRSTMEELKFKEWHKVYRLYQSIKEQSRMLKEESEKMERYFNGKGPTAFF